MPLIQREFQNGEKCSAVPAGENLFDKALAGRDFARFGFQSGRPDFFVPYCYQWETSVL